MDRLRRHCLLSAALPGLAGRAVAAGNPLQRRIGFDAGSAPTMFGGPKGECLGLYPLIVGHCFAELGLHADFEPLPFRRLLDRLERAEGGAGAVIRTAERERIALFSQAYFDELLVVVVGASGALPSGLGSLHGRRIGLIRGWSYGPALDQALERRQLFDERVASDWQNLEKLRRGRIDAVVITQLGWQLLRRREPAYASMREAFAVASNGIHLALPRSWPEAPVLLREFDAAAAALRARGGLARLGEQAIADALRVGGAAW